MNGINFKSKTKTWRNRRDE